jgi:hypothetical protein
MSQLTGLLNLLEHRIGVDDHHLRSAGLKWVESGSVVAPPAVLRALGVFEADFQDAASRAKRIKLADAHERHARKLLIGACGDGARAMQLLRVASGAVDPADQALGWRAGHNLLQSARNAYDAAREAAGCGTSC